MEELERIPPRNNKEAQAQSHACVEDEAEDDSKHVHAEGHGCLTEVVDAHDLAGDEAHQTERSVP